MAGAINTQGPVAVTDLLAASVPSLDIVDTLPVFTITDLTASAKSLKINLANNLAYFHEQAAADGTLLILDLANNRVGVRVAPDHAFHVASSLNDAAAKLASINNQTVSVLNAAKLIAITSGDMADGYGIGLQFLIRDSAAVDNPIGRIDAVRNGSDNSGDLVFTTATNSNLNETLRLTSARTVGINISVPGFHIHALPPSGASAYTVAFESYGAEPNYPVVYGRRAQGVVGAPTAVLNDDKLFVLAGRGYDGSAWNTGSAAAIFLAAHQNFTTAHHGSYISFEVTPNNSTVAARAEALRIDSTSVTFAGNLSLAAAAILQWNADTMLVRDGAANILALKNGEAAQTLRIYGKVSTGLYVHLTHNGTNSVISGNGTGAIQLIPSAAAQGWQATSGGHWVATDDNNRDIGAVASTRPRTGYFATSVVAPTFKTTTAIVTPAGGSTIPLFGSAAIGGAGQPATAAQNGWLIMQNSAGASIYVPCWV